MRKLSLFLFFVQFASIFSATIAQEAECSKDKACKKGCCSKFGYCGLGKDFCAPENCLNNCERKAECDPGNFGNEYVEAEKCPLNICCSKHGFCGTTKDFCGSQIVKKPSECNSRRKFNRVVGYYESWSMTRSCNAFNPEKIPIGVYTHLNFAFATINPTTFELQPESDQDVYMYKRLVSLKKKDPDLKILIALGGWTFNDPGPTATTFSDIASSEANQKKFLKSLISFMATYGFDGLDLDWEYPGAKDRSGRDVDFKNFPKFLANIKQALKASGRDTLSITIPASLWYLKHFDIQALQPSVDFFNVMSYDLHGTWDLKNDWVGPYLNAHTNLTEIDDALDLLWRNDISPDKVVMGLAFYGRAFRVEDPSCTEPGCRYGSGAPKQPCSQEVSVILNSEIADVMNSTGAKPKLYEVEAVKVITWDNNWVAYDDEDTLKMKAEFAAKRCLGGVMVWAVSHDAKDAKYSLALAQFAPRDHVLIEKPQDGNTTTYTSHEQCKWTNCREGCPSGWSTIKRSDDSARQNEIMQDGQGCDGYGVHTLCCPPGNGLPSCGWYGHRNGDCHGECPSDMVSVATNNQHCYRTGMIGLRGYQTACCSSGYGMGSHDKVFDNMKLHSQCEWGAWPYCDEKCGSSEKNDLVSKSREGSGGAVCLAGKRGYCCDNDDVNWKWDSCEWYKDYGDGPEGSKNCKPGCPSNKVRVSMESTDCKNGAWAYCCSATARTVEKRSNPMLKVYEDSLRTFIKDPTCPANYTEGESGLMAVKDSLFVSVQGNSTSGSGMVRRSSSTVTLEGVKDVVDILRDDFVSLDITNLWNDVVGSRFTSLTAANVHEFFSNDPYSLIAMGGFSMAVTYFVCNFESMNVLLGGDTNSPFSCTARPKNPCDEDDEETSSIFANLPIKWTATDKNGASFSGQYTKIRPLTGNGWDPTDPVQRVMYQTVYTSPARNCEVINMRTQDMLADRLNGPLFNVDTEHPVEGQTVKLFYQDGIKGRLPNGKDSAHSLPGDFITGTLQDTQIVLGLNPVPDPPRGHTSNNIAAYHSLEKRLLNALGSRYNNDVFVLADKDLNCMKESLWAGMDPVAESIMKKLLTQNTADADIVLTYIRNVIGIVSYLNDATLHDKMKKVIMEFRKQLRVAERAHLKRTGVKVEAVAFFDEWMPKLFERIRGNMISFTQTWCDKLDAAWQGVPQAQGVIKQTKQLRASATATRTNINQRNFYDSV